MHDGAGPRWVCGVSVPPNEVEMGVRNPFGRDLWVWPEGNEDAWFAVLRLLSFANYAITVTVSGSGNHRLQETLLWTGKTLLARKRRP